MILKDRASRWFCLALVMVLATMSLAAGEEMGDSSPATDTPKIKVLYLAGGKIHNFKAIAGVVTPYLRDDSRFDVTLVLDDLDALLPHRLAPYDVIVFYYTVGTITEAQREGLLNWVASGKGYVGFHSAADSFRDDKKYQKFVGGHFIGHPHYRTYQVSVKDPGHPIMKGLPKDFLFTGEQYILKYDPKELHILASGLWKGEAMPWAWTRKWGEGRVFYVGAGHDARECRQEFAEQVAGGVIGHDVRACGKDIFRDIITKAVTWAAGK